MLSTAWKVQRECRAEFRNLEVTGLLRQAADVRKTMSKNAYIIDNPNRSEKKPSSSAEYVAGMGDPEPHPGCPGPTLRFSSKAGQMSGLIQYSPDFNPDLNSFISASTNDASTGVKNDTMMGSDISGGIPNAGDLTGKTWSIHDSVTSVDQAALNITASRAGDTVTFRHDTLRDWTIGFVLDERPELRMALPVDRPLPGTLARGLEIAARLALENDTTGAQWLALLAEFERDGCHGSWRRPVLMALPRSENAFELFER